MSENSNSLPRYGAQETFDSSDNFRDQRPEHHIHRDSEPLPGNDPTNNNFNQSQDFGAREPRRDTGMSFVRFLFCYIYLNNRCG